ncbi:Bug family tripartite tricarboxylate transporter substrate binding protein [Advenella kashmirensis]|nr:tripartite tricarboxylate transporter substrate binding protein [Advenella kashmirensis]
MKSNAFRYMFAGLAVAATATIPFGAARADAVWEPERPVRIVVPYGPGGSSDVIARAIGAEMAKGLGQAVVIENKGGSQGVIAMQDVARARPDGYSLVLGHVGTLAVNPAMMPNLPYDVKKDFAPITLLAKVPMIFAVSAQVPVTTFEAFIEMARKQPGQLNYGSAGNGSAGHLAFEMLKTATGIQVQHIPYKGTGAQITDLIAGRTQAASAGTPGLLPLAKAGQVHIIAVGSRKRLEVLPDVPTVAERGYPGFESSQWFGLLAPAGTPQPVIDRLNQEALKALRSASVQTRLEHDSSEMVGWGPQKFASFIDDEAVRWGKVVRQANLQSN